MMKERTRLPGPGQTAVQNEKEGSYLKMRGHSRRLLSVLLALIMLLSLLPAAVLAADATAKTFKKVKSGD